MVTHYQWKTYSPFESFFFVFQGPILHISAETSRLLYAAEMAQMQKPLRDGTLRDFTFADIDMFQNSSMYTYQFNSNMYFNSHLFCLSKKRLIWFL